MTLFHQGNDPRATSIEHARQISFKNHPPVFISHHHQRFVSNDPCVVHDTGETAKMIGDLPYDSFHTCEIPDVSLICNCLAASIVDLTSNCFRFFAAL